MGSNSRTYRTPLYETPSEPTSVTATERVTVALAYGDGVSVETLGDRLGIPRSTIYYWSGRFEEASVEAAVGDDGYPGRPLTLGFETESGRRGRCATTWRRSTESSARREYSEGHVRRSLRSLRDISGGSPNPRRPERDTIIYVHLVLYSGNRTEGVAAAPWRTRGPRPHRRAPESLGRWGRRHRRDVRSSPVRSVTAYL